MYNGNYTLGNITITLYTIICIFDKVIFQVYFYVINILQLHLKYIVGYNYISAQTPVIVYIWYIHSK